MIDDTGNDPVDVRECVRIGAGRSTTKDRKWALYSVAYMYNGELYTDRFPFNDPRLIASMVRERHNQAALI